ncbi:DUF3566 domain-containing protein [Bifidobacterium aerophilum]|uniref:DUF3566 domain-containing protein n=1 Tax=Bifidobacterium aerophilum TaxID=1798155 RepID=A0A6N9Z7W1_9BIFI|nr:DUF3566 domain-containing protein [Bifidobacterium aerophilum]NEG90444.1 DUF3566 domain-containing protein [Bifidobacterium aerophilum]
MSENPEEGDVIQPAGFAPETAGEAPASQPAESHEHIGRVARSVVGESGAAAAPASVPPTSRPNKKKRGTPRARRMNLSVTHVSAWSAAKVSFLLGIAGGIIQIVAVLIVWLLLNAVGVFEQITTIVKSTGLDTGSFDLASIISLPTVLSATTIFSIVEVVIFTLLVTILTLLYNVVTALVGGVHVTLGDD